MVSAPQISTERFVGGSDRPISRMFVSALLCMILWCHILPAVSSATATDSVSERAVSPSSATNDASTMVVASPALPSGTSAVSAPTATTTLASPTACDVVADGNTSAVIYAGCNMTSFNPNGPLVRCDNLPMEFITCDAPLDLTDNPALAESLGYGCVVYGGEKYASVQRTSVPCRALEGIECYGNRTFLVGGVPCIRYSGQHFPSTLLLSLFLGILGVDRFVLGHIATGVGKLITLGGVGVWWIVDIVLLCTGTLGPADGSSWVPFY
eukprot:Opistho-2@75397